MSERESSPAMVEGASVPARFRDLAWGDRLAHIVETMREVSSISDPMEMTRVYAKRMRGTISDGELIAVSRRDLSSPEYRITRFSKWAHQPNPWKQTHLLPRLSGGILADLIYGEQPRILAPLRVNPDDPAAGYFEGARSAMAIPQFEDGRTLNMIVLTSREERPIDPERFPDLVLQTNLVGRGTRALVLGHELRAAYEAIDRELRIVQDLQLSLLPAQPPVVPTLDLASHYQTSARAGGDLYDYYDLSGGRVGVMVGDVSGHGAPAAVLMAIVHAVARLHPGEPCPPEVVVGFINRHLCERYTRESGAFCTMLYGVYDPGARTFTYANAGHPEPLVRGVDGSVRAHAHPGAGLPAGVMREAEYGAHRMTLTPGEALVLYTDGIPEAFNPAGEMYGAERLARAVSRAPASAEEIVSAVVADLGEFAGLTSRSDDRTLVVGLVK